MSDTTTELPAAVTVPADYLGQLDEHTRKVEIEPANVDPNAPVVVERLRQDERLVVHSLEEHLDAPLRQRGEVVVHDPTDFAQLVNRLADAHRSMVYADVDSSRIVAVFDDHGQDGLTGWRQHRATLTLKADADWELWTSHNNRLMRQDAFATLLEDVAHTVVTPDAATMLEVATGFRASRRAEFSSEIDVQSGDVKLAYQEVTDAKAGRTRSGDVEIPREFTIRIAPWRGVDPVEVKARLRYDVDKGQLGIGFSLLRADRARDDAFATLINRIREELDEAVPLLKGVAPAALRASA